MNTRHLTLGALAAMLALGGAGPVSAQGAGPSAGQGAKSGDAPAVATPNPPADTRDPGKTATDAITNPAAVPPSEGRPGTAAPPGGGGPASTAPAR